MISLRYGRNGYRGVSAAPLPPRSSFYGAQLPIIHQRGKPQQQPNEEDQLQAAAGAEEPLYNSPDLHNCPAGSSAGAPADGDAAVSSSGSGGSGGAMGRRSSSPVPASASTSTDASAVAAAQLLRGALEAALLPRLEAMEGRIVGAMEGSIAERIKAMEERLAMGERMGERQRGPTTAPEAVMTAVRRDQGQREQMEEQRERDEVEAHQAQEHEQEQPLAATLAALEQRIREELKVRSVGWGVRAGSTAGSTRAGLV